ncbi:MAG: DUF5696 domain-containing protein [Candidatus Cohnella colombiensis]|uniref:DUF5696 domain-containing protein n=1 Tax=Candidatus Cohnella colombiensis TaxID=3121368 RepID=A0AA95EWJ5_9BACL|nr:MAG: DUF5696 domain-containing protein [Cohnella sp.]
MKKKLTIGAIVAVVVFGLAFWVYWISRSVPALEVLPDLRNVTNNAASETYTKPTIPLEGMEGIASNGKLSLYMDKETMAVAIRDQSGKIWRSNPEKLAEDELANASVKDQMSSQVLISYSNMTGQEATKTSYQDSVLLGQAVAEPIEGGVRVTYTMGKATNAIDALPVSISAERYQMLILDKVGEKYKRYLTVGYKNDSNPDVYVRNDRELTAIKLTKVVEAFKEAGYTPDDLAIDNGSSGVNGDREVFTVPVEYTIQGDQFVAKIASSGIQFPKSFQLTDIALLPYFGAADLQDEGYMFVPDGIGSLIHLNNGKERYENYIQPVYGDDGGTWNGEYDDDPTVEPIRMPVYGLKKQGAAFLAIIDQGEAVASIHAEVSRSKSSYNSVYASFLLVAKEKINLSATTADSSTKSKTIPVFQQRPVYSDFSIRYGFLSDDSADYMGMATYYRNYLQRNQVLTKLEEKADTPFYLEVVGGITKRESLLGVPYQAVIPLTTFDETKSIISTLKQQDVSTLKVRLSGWFNKGVTHGIADHIKIDGVLGGKSGYKDLVSYANDENITLYPDVSFSHLYYDASNGRYTDSKAVVRQVNRLTAWVWERTDWARPLSARLIPHVVSEFLDSYEKYGTTGISLRNMGHMLEGDYRRNNVVDRVQAQKIYEDEFGVIQSQLPDVMVDGGNIYSLPYAKDIVEAPMTNNGYNLTDEAVPFYQLVLHGFVDYTGTALNLVPDADSKRYILNSLEYGSNVYVKWIYADNSEIKDTFFLHLYSVNYEVWLDEAVAAYKTVNEVLKDVRDKPIVNHEKLADNVYRTTYEGGKKITVNYNPFAVKIDGQDIPAQDFYVGGQA